MMGLEYAADESVQILYMGGQYWNTSCNDKEYVDSESYMHREG